MGNSESTKKLENFKLEYERLRREKDEVLMNRLETQRQEAVEQSSKPWREFGRNGGWTPEYHAKLMSEIREGEDSEELQNARFLFLGPIGSGKSSFINSVASIDQDRIATPHLAGEAGISLSFKLKLYQPRKRLGHFILCDTMGFSDNDDFTVQDVIYLIDGNIRPDYKLDRSGPVDTNDPGVFNKSPSLMEKSKCVVLVIDSEIIFYDVLTEKAAKKIAAVQKHIRNKEVPTVIILTKIDKLCVELQNDIKTTHDNSMINVVVCKAAELFGIQKKNIFPVKNYTDELDTDINKDILILLAVKKMMEMAVDYQRSLQQSGQDATADT